MSWELLLVLGAITYASRAVALVVLPSLSPELRAVINRVPAALFAGLAAHSLIVPGSGLVDAPVLAAAAGAVIVTPLRSLPVCLVAGMAGYFAWSLIA